jgi:hypothetical protein
VCAQVHFNIYKEIALKVENKHWYEHVPKLVVASRESKVNILQNQQLQTDRKIPDSKPDTITHNNDNGICMLIYVAISGERKVLKKEAEKIMKHRSLPKKQCILNVKIIDTNRQSGN